MLILPLVEIICLLWGMRAYNSLVIRRNRAENALAAVDALLEKRFDLIPNMVAAVKEYASHEAETFAETTRLRAPAHAQPAESDPDGSERTFSAVSRRFFGIVENYPQLKASENFLHLQRTLNETEEQLSAARRAYNAAATEYNTRTETFPGNLLAGPFGFRKKALLEIPAAERRTPDVATLFDS